MALDLTRLGSLPAIEVTDAWNRLLDRSSAATLAPVVARYLPEQRWFRSKARAPSRVGIADVVALPHAEVSACLALARVDYTTGAPEHYLLLLAMAEPPRVEALLRARPQDAIARVARPDGGLAMLYEAAGDPTVTRTLVELIAEGRRLDGARSTIRARSTSAFARLRGTGPLEPRLLGAEQTNTSIRLGERLIFKLYRRLEDGVSPDLELGLYLTEQARYAHTPAVAGHLELARGHDAPVTLALLQAYVPNDGDAWARTLAELGAHLDALPAGPPASLDAAARLIGQRTGELHLALAAARDVPDMAPEPFGRDALRALHDQMQRHRTAVFEQLRGALPRLAPDLPAPVRSAVANALDLEARAADALHALLAVDEAGQRIRIHGDYHLGQLLSVGDDVFVIDFEGEPARPLDERRLKRSALADVAGMLRSFQYAAATACLRRAAASGEDPPLRIDEAARAWERRAGAAFLERYLETASRGAFLPPSAGAVSTLLSVHLVDKAIYELAYELNHRPTWLHVPARGLLQLLGTGAAPTIYDS